MTLRWTLILLALCTTLSLAESAHAQQPIASTVSQHGELTTGDGYSEPYSEEPTECYFGCDDYCSQDTWAFRASALWLERRSQTAPVSPVLGPTLLGPVVFDPGRESGYELELRRFLPCDRQIVARWFDVDGWNDQFSQAAPLQTGSFTYASRLRSFDIMYRKGTCGCINPSIGFRFVQFRVNSNEAVNINGNAASLNTDITNNMFGIQLGTDGILWRKNRWVFDYAANFAALGNDLDATFVLDNNALFSPSQFGASDENAIFLAELAFNLRFAITNCLSIRSGYRCIWIDGISDVSNVVPADLTNVNFSHDTAIFHGLDLGLEFVW